MPLHHLLHTKYTKGPILSTMRWCFKTVQSLLKRERLGWLHQKKGAAVVAPAITARRDGNQTTCSAAQDWSSNRRKRTSILCHRPEGIWREPLTEQVILYEQDIARPCKTPLSLFINYCKMETKIFFGRVCYCEQSMQTPHIHLYTPKQIQTTPTAAAFLAHLFKSSRRPNNIANLVVVDVVTGASSSCWVWAIRRRFQSIGNQLPQASSHRKGDQASCTIHLSLLPPLGQVSATSKKPLRISQNCSSSRVPSFRAWMVWKKLRNRHLCHNLATPPTYQYYQYLSIHDEWWL